MSNNSSNNKRIAKNTLFLYFRMLFLMVVTLYTSRVILSSLGIEDYGIYNVVGGIVAMFSILNKSLSSAVSRFLNFEMGAGNSERLNRVFSCSVTILTGMAILIAVLTEVFGYWWLNSKMVIPDNRVEAANWVFQFSIIAFCVDLICVPYNAAIIAHEKMSAFAYISIYDGLAKLAVAFLIVISPIDKLVFYAILLLFINLSLRFIYGLYCGRKFSECKFHFVYDKSMLKEIFKYSGWTFIGNSASVLRGQGGNMLLNIFAGPAANAARGVAMQVEHAVTGFSQNFITAVKPQITQSYARGDKKYMMDLVFQSARFSYYLLFFLSMPVMVNANYLLHVWLKDVPEHSEMFLDLMITSMLVDTLSQPLIIANNATGNIRNYQIIVGGIQLLNLPFSYLLLKMGLFPEIVFIVALLLNICSLIARLSMLRKQINLNVRKFVSNVILNVSKISLISVTIPILLVNTLSHNLVHFIFTLFAGLICAAITIFYIGCNASERKLVYKQILKVIRRIF